MNYDQRHGGAYDRGGADSWYGREFAPHYFVGATHSSDKVTEENMTADEIAAYKPGYEETPFAQKQW